MIHSFTKLNRLLKDNDYRLYFIVGNDNYLISECVKEIRRKHSDDEITKFDMAELDIDNLQESFNTYSFFRKKLLVINGYNPSKLSAELKKLFEMLFDSINDALTVVLTNYVSGRFSIAKAYEKQADSVASSVVISAEKPTGQNAYRVIADLAANEGVSITSEAIGLLLLLSGDEYLNIAQEIKKLAALSGYTEIQKDHVLRITTKSTENSVFDMISALEKRDIRTALRILKEMNDNRIEPLSISSTLNTAFINLYRAKLLSISRRNPNDMYNLFDYRKDDRKVSIALNRSGGYTKAYLGVILEILLKLDLDLKSSPVNHSILLEEAIIKIAALRT